MARKKTMSRLRFGVALFVSCYAWSLAGCAQDLVYVSEKPTPIRGSLPEATAISRNIDELSTTATPGIATSEPAICPDGVASLYGRNGGYAYSFAHDTGVSIAYGEWPLTATDAARVLSVSMGETPILPKWSPDAGRLAFVVRQPSGQHHLALFDVAASRISYQDLGDPALAVETPANDLITPSIDVYGDWYAWSPDGQRIAYLGYSNSENVLVLLDSNAMSSTTLRLPDLSSIGLSISWKEDSTELAIVGASDAQGILFGALEVNVSTGNITWAPIDGNVRYSNWQLHGPLLALVYWNESGPGDYLEFRMDTATANLPSQQLEAPIQAIGWSLDGSWFAYALDAYKIGATGQRELKQRDIYVVSPHETMAHLIASEPAYDIVSASWMPDSHHISLSRSIEGNREAISIDLCSSESSQLGFHNRDITSAISWTPMTPPLGP